MGFNEKQNYYSYIVIGYLYFCSLSFGKKKRNELSELGTSVQNVKLEYKNERGFGNNRFDIYSYSLEDEVNFNNEYANLKEIYQKEFRSILNTESKKNQVLKEKQNQIENLLNRESVKGETFYL